MANFASVPAHVNLNVTTPSHGDSLQYTSISAPGTALHRDQGVTWSGTLSPSAPPQVVSIAPGGEPYGYFPLSGAPLPASDESITNLSVPPFLYGGEVYTQIGVVSDGYLVVGGGDSSDVDFVAHLFPNPDRPNNVIAPIWTDLNPAFGGAIRASVVGDGTSSWIVVDYAAVRNYGNATTHTYQAWIRIGLAPSDEQISLVYSATANAATGDGPINWGAENRDGSSGQNLASAPANGSTYLVTLNPPTAGGTQTITFNVSTRKTGGVYDSVAALTSDVTPGITQVVQTFTVTP